MGLDNVLSRVLAAAYDVIGVSFSSQRNFQDSQIVVERLRKEGVASHITVGGHFATFEAHNILTHIPAIDSVVRGEGEHTIVELVQRIETGKSLYGVNGLTFRHGGEIIENKLRPNIKDLDSIPFPARDTIEFVLEGNNFTQVLAQRGCYGHCAFCSIQSFYDAPRVRRRTPPDVLDEIESLVSDHGAQRISFVDDEFADKSVRSRRWIEKLCRGIKARELDIELWIQMRPDNCTETILAPLLDVGLKKVFIGIESVSQNVLDHFNKQVTTSDVLEAVALTDSLGLEQQIGFIMFEPDMTIEDLRNHYDWIRHYEYSEPVHYYSYALPYTGTPLRKKLLREGRLITRSWYDVGTYEFKDSRVGEVFDGMQALMPQITKMETSFDRGLISHRRAMDYVLNMNSSSRAKCRKSIRALQQFDKNRKAKVQAIMRDVFGKLLAASESGDKSLISECRRTLEKTVRSFHSEESAIRAKCRYIERRSGAV
jgi:radical SAM superfamily enzyme YgiQ (UPF0313 family)